LGTLTATVDIQLALAEIFQERQIAKLRGMKDAFYLGPDTYSLYDSVTSVIENQYPTSSGHFSRIIKVAEVRHSQTVQWFSLIAAATVGALAGFLASFLGHAL
jgi:hypothetical protein